MYVRLMIHITKRKSTMGCFKDLDSGSWKVYSTLPIKEIILLMFASNNYFGKDNAEEFNSTLNHCILQVIHIR